MRTNLKFLTYALLALLVTTQFTSCSKDSDLLSDYVINEKFDALSRLVINDNFAVAPGETALLDVLSNDQFDNLENVSIIGTSEPQNGTVNINGDNTLTYTSDTTELQPETTSEEGLPDTFEYTVEQTTENGQIVAETGVVNINNKIPTSGANVFYVTTNGKSTNDGKSEQSSWDLVHAFKAAMAGDVIHVKAGNYGAIKLITSRAGTEDNPIQFIGYQNSPGDIVATDGPTYTKTQWAANGDRFPSDVMPLLDWSAPNDKPVGGDDAISVRHSYINIKNIMCQDYMIGFDARAANVNFDNVLAAHLGDWDPNGNCWNQASSVGCTNNNGYGIRYLNAPNGVLSNSLVIDAGMISVFIVSSDYVDILKTECWTVNPGNGTDYMFEYGDSDYGNIIDCFAKREHTLASSHTSRLIAIKCNSNFNTITNFVGERSKIQVHNADNNSFKNISISGELAEFQIIGGADENIVENLEISNGFGISFLGWTGNECGVPKGSDIGAGSNNYFIDTTIRDQVNTPQNAVVSFHRLSALSKANTGPNYIVNLTAINFNWLLNKQRTGTVSFTNSTFRNSKKTEIDVGSAIVDVSYSNCNFIDNAFASPNGN